MEHVVYKYEMQPPRDESCLTETEIPNCAKVLAIDQYFDIVEKRNYMYIWASGPYDEMNSALKKMARIFVILTGFPFDPEGKEYMTTLLMRVYNPPLVWHIYKLLERAT